MDVTPHASVDGFFHEVVTDALQAVHLDATETTEWYLVSLLGDFAQARITDEPLVVKLVGSQSAEPAERFRRLKEVGDTSLYVSGFFAESLGRKLVDVDYYVGLGSRAYAELAGRMSGSLTEVYAELSQKFPAFVEVITEVRRRCDFAGADIVRLYEQWVQTRDAWIERKLKALGVLVEPVGTLQ
ncbi:MAG: hypothetical protein H6708_10775 [Kofleriaceae bacterium]|nr:hypothetical protein [Myxococcales bacterium]MCB9560880.1 hypothetical protein [Kofleriaceae bacterium]